MSIFLIFIVSTLFVFWPTLLGGQVMVGPYASQVHYPIYFYLSKFLHSENTIPLWFDQLLSGFPIYLSQQGGFLYPLTVFFSRFLSFPDSYHWFTFFNFALGGIFAYVLARNLSLSKSASVIVGIAYIFGRETLYLGGQMPLFSTFYPLVPLIFLSVLKISEGKRFYILFGGFITGLAWLAGFTESVFYAVVCALVFAIFLDAKDSNRELSWLENLKKFKTVWGFMIVIAIGALLASPWLLPTYNFVSHTPRSGGVDAWKEASAYSSPASYLYSSIFPFLNVGFGGISSFVFVGVLVYVFAFFSFFAIRKNKFLPYFVGLFVFTFLIFFKPSQVFRLVHSLPLFSFFYGSWKWTFMANFSLAFLAGFGLDYLREVKKKINFKFFVRAMEVFVFYFLLFVLASALFSFEFVNYKFFISSFFIVLSVLAFSVYGRGFVKFSQFKKIAAGVVVLSFVFGWQGAFEYTDKETYLVTPETVDFIKENLGDEYFRIIDALSSAEYDKVLSVGGIEWLKYNLAAGVTNYHIVFDVSSAGGVEAFNTRRHEKLLYEDRRSFFKNTSFVSMMNVKYVLSSNELAFPFKKVFETTVTKYDIPVYIYENPNVLPRVYFAESVVYTSETNEEKLFEELLAIDNFKNKTLIECGKVVCAVDYYPNARNKDVITIEELKNGHLKLKTRTNQPRWLIYSESNLPTWEARIDGELTKIYMANYIYQTIFVPAGEHEIEFKYPGVFAQMRYAIKDLFILL